MASTSARPQAPHAEALRQEQALLLHDLGRDVRVARESHRRQAVAASAGLTTEDAAPVLSDREQLEEDLITDNEEERVASAAEAAGELPVRYCLTFSLNHY